MWRFLIGLFIVLHGLVHLWYVVLSQRLIEFRPEMGWTARSWLLSNLFGDTTTRSLASVLYVLAAIALVASGAGISLRTPWWRPVLLGSVLFSSVVILLLWDGSPQRLIQKGLIGLLIDLAIIAVLGRGLSS